MIGVPSLSKLLPPPFIAAAREATKNLAMLCVWMGITLLIDDKCVPAALSLPPSPSFSRFSRFSLSLSLSFPVSACVHLSLYFPACVSPSLISLSLLYFSLTILFSP